MDLQHWKIVTDFRRALRAAEAGNEKQAIQELTRLSVRTRTMGRTHAKILRAKARLLYQYGSPSRALVDSCRCLRMGHLTRRERGDLLLLIANCGEELRRPKLVNDSLRQACRLGRISARTAFTTLHNFGVRCNLRGESNLGFEYFNFVVQNENIASTWVFCNALINRGCWFGSEEYYGLAEDDFQRAIAKCGISPDLLVRAQFNLGNVYWNTREYPKAIEYFELVLQSSVNATDLKDLARCKMAQSLEQLGKC